jgi:hypothetical protein
MNSVSRLQTACVALTDGQNHDFRAAFETPRRPLHGLAARVADGVTCVAFCFIFSFPLSPTQFSCWN